MNNILALLAMLIGMVFGYLVGLGMLPKWFYRPRWHKGGRESYRESFREWDLLDVYEDGYKDGSREYAAIITMSIGGALATWLARQIGWLFQQTW